MKLDHISFNNPSNIDRDALSEWASAVAPNTEGITNMRRRPHILKLDVEGKWSLVDLC